MTFKTINIIACALLVVLLLANFIGHVPWWSYALLVVGYVSVVVWGCMTISSDFFLPVVCGANTSEKVVALTFDDGPHPDFTPMILNALKRHDVTATFFCIGKNIKGNEAILSRMKDEGHIIANHSYGHDFWFDMFGSSKMMADMRHTDREVLRTTGLIPKLFRPPYGVTNPNLRRAINDGKYTPVGWSLRSMDTVAKDRATLLGKITGPMKGGDIILLHDSLQITAEMMQELLNEIGKKGFTIVPLTKMINIKAYA